MAVANPDLKVGDGVEARVVERTLNGDLIISCDGQLIRVLNQTRQNFRPGEWVRLSVTAINPLKFSLLSGPGRARRGGLHVLG